MTRLINQIRAEVLESLVRHLRQEAESEGEDAAAESRSFSLEHDLQPFQYSRLLGIEHTGNSAYGDGRLLFRFDEGDIIFDAGGGILIQRRDGSSVSTKVGNR